MLQCPPLMVTRKFEMVFVSDAGNIIYDLAELEPQIHLLTYLAVASMILINSVQVVALQVPPTVPSKTEWLDTTDTSLMVYSSLIVGKIWGKRTPRLGFPTLFRLSRPSSRRHYLQFRKSFRHESRLWLSHTFCHSSVPASQLAPIICIWSSADKLSLV
jgi:hypothetical protein